MAELRAEVTRLEDLIFAATGKRHAVVMISENLEFDDEPTMPAYTLALDAFGGNWPEGMNVEIINIDRELNEDKS